MGLVDLGLGHPATAAVVVAVVDVAVPAAYAVAIKIKAQKDIQSSLVLDGLG